MHQTGFAICTPLYEQEPLVLPWQRLPVLLIAGTKAESCHSLSIGPCITSIADTKRSTPAPNSVRMVADKAKCHSGRAVNKPNVAASRPISTGFQIGPCRPLRPSPCGPLKRATRAIMRASARALSGPCQAEPEYRSQPFKLTLTPALQMPAVLSCLRTMLGEQPAHHPSIERFHQYAQGSLP